MVKNPPVYAGDSRDPSPIPGSGRSPGEALAPTPYSCVGNPTDRGAWWATVQGVTEDSDTTEQLTTHTQASVGNTESSQRVVSQAPDIPEFLEME